MDFKNLYRDLSDLGPIYPLKMHIDAGLYEKEIAEFSEQWVHYNPRKKNERYGLSLFSLDGGTSGIPDLDSLKEYNEIHKTSYRESDFKTPTPIYKQLKSINECLKPLEEHICRSHLLMLKAGGHFAPHRDAYGSEESTFRLIALLKGSSSSNFALMLSGQRVYLDLYTIYFLDVKIDHSVFSFGENSQLLVLNVSLNDESIRFVKKTLQNS